MSGPDDIVRLSVSALWTLTTAYSGFSEAMVINTRKHPLSALIKSFDGTIFFPTKKKVYNHIKSAHPTEPPPL